MNRHLRITRSMGAEARGMRKINWVSGVRWQRAWSPSQAPVPGRVTGRRSTGPLSRLSREPDAETDKDETGQAFQAPLDLRMAEPAHAVVHHPHQHAHPEPGL